MVRSKITSRNAWRSALTWAVPGVFTTSTSSPSSRNRPSSRATSTARSWTAFIIETRTGFRSVCVVIVAPPKCSCVLTHACARLVAPPMRALARTTGGGITVYLRRQAMAQYNWSGIHIPIITPFKDNYSIDEDGLRRLVDYCIEEQKADGLVPCGTTGESPTLSHEEHQRVIEIVIQATAGRVPVIAGTGSNSTREAIDMTKHAEQAGAAASLQVCPYYNKPEQHGLMAHFEAVAKETTLPIILYNIPGRTGRLIEWKTLVEL